MKKYKNKWITFEGCENTIYKVIEEDNNYVLVEDSTGKYYERKEFIEKIIKI